MTEQSVFVIRDLDMSDYKGRHVGVADDMLTAQIFAQSHYAREHYNHPVWIDQEWRQNNWAEGETFRRFTTQQGQTHEIIITKETMITVEVLSTPIAGG